VAGGGALGGGGGALGGTGGDEGTVGESLDRGLGFGKIDITLLVE